MMTLRRFFPLVMLLGSLPAPAASESSRPNVVTIILDDAGWMDVGYHGGDIKTPVMDRLAGGGLRLNAFYTYSTCTPTRAAFFTGRAPSRSGIVYPIQHDDSYGLPPEVDTLPEVFQRNGYRTALIGKWHLGGQPEFAPGAHGFDYHYGLLGGWADQFTRENPKTGCDWVRNHEPLEREEGHTTDLLTDDAIRYISESGGDPFFLCLSYTAPHVPIQVDPRWAAPYRGRFATRTRVGYAGMMAHLDHSVGRVLQTLEMRGLAENTLVVLFSDNGPSAPGPKWYIPEDAFTQHFYGNDGRYGEVAPLRGWKASPYEGGVRVPAFLYWKDQLESGEHDSPVIVEDLYRTLLGLAGIPLDDEGYQPDGRDFLSAAVADPVTFYWRTPRNLALRRGPWKLILQNQSPFEDPLHAELYDIEADIAEREDCAGTHPEQLQALLELLQEEFRKDPPPHVNPALLDK
jgi:arylsulfatase A-like enzyme